MQGWQLTTVVSGGQTGADQAGICAAKFLDYRTGGKIAKGWLTELGSEPWLREFGLTETASFSLRSRSYANVVAADATVIFTEEILAWEKGSAAARKRIRESKAHLVGNITPAQILASYNIPPFSGSAYTLELAIAHRKPCIVNPNDAEILREFLYHTQAKTLNVAGSRESKAPGMYRWVYDFLVDALVPF